MGAGVEGKGNRGGRFLRPWNLGVAILWIAADSNYGITGAGGMGAAYRASGTKLNRDLSELQTLIESNIFVTICAMIVHGSVDKYLVRLFYAIALSVRQFSFLS